MKTQHRTTSRICLILLLLVAFYAPSAATTTLAASLVTKLIAADAGPGDLFGLSVAVDGETAVVGAPADADYGSNAGAVFVFHYDGANWLQEAKLYAADAAAFDRFGSAVAISQDTIIVGAYADSDAGSSSGSAYVFREAPSGWVQEAKLTSADAAAFDRFGWSVAIDGWEIVVGAYGDSDAALNSGSAYVFRYDGSVWHQEDKLVAADAGFFDFFGWSVAINGDTVVVGAPYASDLGGNAGLAYVFKCNGIEWIQQTRLIAPTPVPGDQFGRSVGVSGNRLLVGVPLADDTALDAGSAYLFRFNGAAWGVETRLNPIGASLSDQFGWSVALSGDNAVVGAYGDTDYGTDAGAAYAFSGASGDWVELERLTPTDPAALQRFGWAVALAGERALVGAYGDADAGTDSGAAYMYVPGLPPSITSEPITEATINLPYSYQVVASGTPAPVFALESAPTGLAIDSATGLMSWLPTIAGSYSVTVRASNGIQPDALQSFSILVEEEISGRPVTPVVECVQKNGYGIYTALFGYNNPNASVMSLPVGPDNAFNRYGEDLGQPGVFEPGRQTAVFAVVFDGNPLEWSLNGRSETVSRDYPTTCSDAGITISRVRPMLDCVADNGDGSYTAYFGYQNDNPFSITIPFPVRQHFHTSLEWHRQVFVFEVGRHRFDFTLRLPGGNWSWILEQLTNGEHVPRC